MPEEKIKKTTKHLKEAGSAVKEKMFGYIAAGLGLVAGLAWNDAIKLFIEYSIPKIGNTIIAKLVYAVILTLIVAVVLFHIEKYFIDDEEEEDEEKKKK